MPILTARRARCKPRLIRSASRARRYGVNIIAMRPGNALRCACEFCTHTHAAGYAPGFVALRLQVLHTHTRGREAASTNAPTTQQPSRTALNEKTGGKPK